jgi:hypothetical protein
MSIPVDTYFTVTPGSSVQTVPGFYAKLGGTDLFFYVTETNALRVVNMNSTATNATPGLISYSLAQGVFWLSVITQPGNGTVHVYYQNSAGVLFYAPYALLGGPIAFKQMATVPAGIITFSTLFTNTSTPPCYMLMTDDGIKHTLYVAADPAFQGLISTTVTYNNSLATAVFISRPSIAMHPADTNKITVTCEQTIIQTSVTGVGFYEVKVAGIV